MMKIEHDCVVSFHYRLTDDDGHEIDSSAGQEPMVYLHGAGNIVPGLERELTGRAVGDRVQVTVQPEDGYGGVDPQQVKTLPREMFEGVEAIEPGMRFQATAPDGEMRVVTVQQVGQEGVTVDANHPLAGKVLHFDVTIARIREASEEERSHGHAHG